MVTGKIKELAAARANVARLENAIAAQLAKELAGLPAAFGFADAKAFVAAVKSATKNRRGARRAEKSEKKPRGRRIRRRAVITDATRTEVKKLVEGGKTAKEIAKAVGISLPSVAVIKRRLGLTRQK